MAHQPVCTQVVALLKYRHKEVPCGYVSAHKHVAVAGIYDVYGRLCYVVSWRDINHRVGLSLKPEPLEYGNGPCPVSNQHRLDQALFLGGEQAPEHVLAVGAGQYHTQRPSHLRYTFEYAFKVFKLHTYSYLP